MTNEIDKILAENIPCYFISPHLDDAMLSSGALISYLANKVPVTVVTVFTEASEGLHTISAMQFLKQCGYTSAKALFADRRAEDIKASKLAGVSYEHLGFVDALFRRRTGFWASLLGKYIPEFGHVNPTYRFHIVRGSVSSADVQLTEEITLRIKSMLPKKGPYAIFGPMAQGNHLDHRIARNVCKALASQPFSWLDYPYCIREEMAVTDQPRFTWSGDTSKKTEIIQCYSSQVKAMFGSKEIQLVEEVYY
jgi:LmbE family N-acetylglucosaminyl deacetylase